MSPNGTEIANLVSLLFEAGFENAEMPRKHGARAELQSETSLSGKAS